MMLLAKRALITCLPLLLYLVLFGFSSETTAQTTIVIYKAPNELVKNVTVDLKCGGETRRGTADSSGLFKVDPPTGGQCDIRITGGTLTDEVRFFDYPISEGAENRINIRLANKFAKEMRSGGGTGKSLLIMEKGGNKPIRGAEIVVDCAGDSPYGFSDASGRFYFDSKASGFCTYNVRHPDFEAADGGIDIAKNPRTSIFNVFLEKRRLAGAFTVTVLDADSRQPIAGVDVEISSGADSWARTTDASGVASVSRLILPTNYRVTARHRNYDDASTEVNVAVGAGRAATANLVMRRKAHIKTLTVVVTEDETGRPINEATVRLVGSWFSGYSGTTGPDGVAKIVVDRAGRFSAEVTRDNYLPAKTVFSVEPGANEADLLFNVSMLKKRVNAGGFPIKVKVVSDETNEPLSGASVRTESGDAVLTGEDGWATAQLPGFVGDRTLFFVSKPGYEEISREFTVPRISSVTVAPEFTVTLKKKAADAIKLLVEVSDRDTGKTLAGATVSLDGFSSATTGANGIAEFSLPFDRIKGLTAIQAKATLSGYNDGPSSVSTELLQPRSDPRYYSIALRKKPTNSRNSPYGPGGVWKLRKDYPMMGDDLKAVSGNPNNSASPGTFSFEHTSGIVTKFSFDTPPEVLSWGATLRLSITGTSLTPADASEQTMAKIEVGPSPRLRSKWVGPSGKNIRHDSSVATSDTVTFVFDPKEGTVFNIYFCVVHRPTTCFIYSYEPYPDWAPFASPR
ncbi:MAG: carboxypeptidase regulatory-like domain-containing protein [Chloracidobacterium sp.]|nr:carboxypeptidase regulatory-like domain-containing protein [Chloracidobacterium sp.]